MATPAAVGVLRSGGAERERRLADLPVWALLLSIASSVWRWESAVKKRTRRPAATAPSLWRTIRLPTPPALKMCVECKATETPQWRAGPEGGRTLCNACGVRHRAAGRFYGKLRGPRRPKARGGDSDSGYHQPPPPLPTPLPTPEIPAASSPPESQIWEGPILKGFFRAVRKRKSPATATTTTEMEPATPPAIMHPAPAASPPPATAVNQPQKKTKKQKHTTGGEKKEKHKQQQKKKQCEHCGSSSTAKWRRGEMGIRLCNACGVRYNEGRLLPEYRPRGCPTFNMRMHATSHSQVLRLNRKRYQQLVEDSQDADLMMMEDMLLLDLPAPPPPSPAEAEYYLAGDDLRLRAAIDDGDSSANNNVNAGASGSGTNDYPMMMHLPAPPPSTAEAEYYHSREDDLRAAAAAIDDDSSANNNVNAGASGSGTNVNDYPMMDVAATTTSLLDPFLLEGPAAPMLCIDDDDD